MRAEQGFSQPHRDVGSSEEEEAPAVTARALKMVLYAGAALAIWVFYRLSGGREEPSQSDGLDVDTPEIGSADDYSTWEPAQ